MSDLLDPGYLRNISAKSGRYFDHHKKQSENMTPGSPDTESKSHSYPLTTSTSLTSLLTHRRQSQGGGGGGGGGGLLHSGGDVKQFQIIKFQDIVSSMDEHLASLEQYMQHSKEWKYGELRHILDEQEYLIEDLEGEVERKEEQISRKTQEISELREGLGELEARLSDSFEANRRFREEKIRFEEENQLLRKRLYSQQEIIKTLKQEVRETSKRIRKLSVLNRAATARAGVKKRSVKCQTKENFILGLLKSEKKVERTDFSSQVETLAPPFRPLSKDEETETNL